MSSSCASSCTFVMRMIHPSMLFAGPGPKLAGSKESYAPEACSRSLAAACPRPCGFLDRIDRSDRAGDDRSGDESRQRGRSSRGEGARGGGGEGSGGRTRARGRRESLSSRTEKRRVERTRGWASETFVSSRSLARRRATSERGAGDRRTFVARPSFDGAPVSIVSMVTSSDIIPPSLIARRVLGVAPGE
eukprot:30456-Pelagococcus_subviridis.AAC.4